MARKKTANNTVKTADTELNDTAHKVEVSNNDTTLQSDGTKGYNEKDNEKVNEKEKVVLEDSNDTQDGANNISKSTPKLGNPKFKKGMAPLNPKGRPVGSKNKVPAISKELKKQNFDVIGETVKLFNETTKDSIKAKILETFIKHTFPIEKQMDIDITKTETKTIINVVDPFAAPPLIEDADYEEVIENKQKDE